MRLSLLARSALLFATSALLLAACTGDEAAEPSPTATSPVSATGEPTAAATQGAAPTASPAATATGPLTADAIAFEPALEARAFERPIEFGRYPTGSGGGTGGSAYVVEQDGRVLLFHAGEETTLLDISAQVSRSGNEEGLLSLALDPAFTENGYVWLYYSVADGERRTRLARFTADLEAGGAIDPGTELVVLEQPQPYANHNGGAIRFGPDGLLYLGFGDGGDADDPHDNGQDLSTLLGSVIRIDVGTTSADAPYAVPEDNPFVDEADARPEIWAYGLRNPWRMAFDPESGDLWLADVGQNAWEEVDVIEAGGNYGWNRMEGFECFEPPSGCDQEGLVPPVAVYSHDAGCSVSGGFVYRGEAVPALRGHYVYGDYCSGALWAIDVNERGEPISLGSVDGQIAAFGLDDAGELYVLVFGGPVLQIVPS